jgi:hypothetical protein
MKRIAVLLLVALATVGLGAGAQAQSGRSPAAAQAPASGETKGQTTTERDGSSRPAEEGSALPRTAATERTTLFGLRPTAAVVLAAALLVVVIVAIVAMTRSA